MRCTDSPKSPRASHLQPVRSVSSTNRREVSSHGDSTRSPSLADCKSHFRCHCVAREERQLTAHAFCCLGQISGGPSFSSGSSDSDSEGRGRGSRRAQVSTGWRGGGERGDAGPWPWEIEEPMKVLFCSRTHSQVGRREGNGGMNDAPRCCMTMRKFCHSTD